MAELAGVATPLPLAVSTLLLWIFGLNFSTTLKSLISSSSLSSGGRGNKFLVAILCIAIVPVVIPVPSHRGCCHSSISGPRQRGGLKNSGHNASLSDSQYFNIIVRGVLVCADWFRPFGHHPRPCARRVRLPLFCFDPFHISLELLPLLDLAIAWDLLDPTLSLSLPMPLPRPLFLLEGETASSSPPPLYPSSFTFSFFFALSAAVCLFYLIPLSSTSDLSLSPDPWPP